MFYCGGNNLTLDNSRCFSPMINEIVDGANEEQDIHNLIILVGVGDASLRMHRLHDVLQFFETSLKNCIAN